MGLFDEVKQSVTVRQAAEMYGFKPDRSGLIRCIFHNDKTPSMKVDRRYFCFGCGCTGDAIDFVAQLFGLNLKDAALKLAEDFGIQYSNQRNNLSYTKKKPVVKMEQRKKEDYTKCVRTYLGYYSMLLEWKKQYAPKTSEEEWDERFVYAVQKMDVVEYYLDILLFGDVEDRDKLVHDLWREVEQIEFKCSEYFNRTRKECNEKNGENGRQKSCERNQRAS